VGKRQRHSDLVEHSIEELQRMLKDRNRSSAERLKIVTELKFPQGPQQTEEVEMSTANSYTRRMGTTTTPHSSALDPFSRRPRYRRRSWLIAYLPTPLAIRVPIGKRDCGQHEWHRYDDKTDVCYHCLVGVRPHQPIDVPMDDEFRMGLLRRAEMGDPFYAAMVEKFRAHDRELGRPRWEPPADPSAADRRKGERLFARVSSMVDAARRSARRHGSP
jgi:hypothetical protein